MLLIIECPNEFRPVAYICLWLGVSLFTGVYKVNAALAEISVIHNKIFLESFWADLDEVMTLKDCEVRY